MAGKNLLAWFLLLTRGAASPPFWLSSMPPVLDPYQELLLHYDVLQCAQLCLRRSCLAMVHLGGEDCRLVVAAGPPSSPPASIVLRCCTEVPLTNVALYKPGRSPSYLDPPSRATDGIFWSQSNHYHSTTDEEFPFLIVDLGAAYVIEAVALMPRLETFGDRFRDIEIRAGVADVAGPDFSSYVLLARFPGPAPAPVTWLEENLEPPVEGRFVSVQRTALGGVNLLELAELRVFGREFKTLITE